jgi:hypothetical protein
MDRRVGYAVTGFRTSGDEETHCEIGNYMDGNLLECFRAATRSGDAWLLETGRAAIRYEIDPIYEVEEDE